jgi:hypothetical protein
MMWLAIMIDGFLPAAEWIPVARKQLQRKIHAFTLVIRHSQVVIDGGVNAKYLGLQKMYFWCTM